MYNNIVIKNVKMLKMLRLGYTQYSIPETIANRSRLYCSLLEYNSSITVLPIPDVIPEIVLQNYSCYDNDNDNNNKSNNTININSTTVLKQCFEYCHLIDDPDYFNYLMCILLKSWSEFRNVINGFNDNLKWDVNLHCCLHLIPDAYLGNQNFFRQWLVCNQYRAFEVDGEVYYYNVVYYHDSSHQYHTKQHYDELYHNNKHNNLYYEGHHNNKHSINYNKVKMLESYKGNGILHGIRMLWYPNTKLQSRQQYVNGILDGIDTTWHHNGNKRSLCTWQQGQLCGVYQKWFPDGITFVCYSEFVNGRMIPGTSYIRHYKDSK